MFCAKIWLTKNGIFYGNGSTTSRTHKHTRPTSYNCFDKRSNVERMEQFSTITKINKPSECHHPFNSCAHTNNRAHNAYQALVAIFHGLTRSPEHIGATYDGHQSVHELIFVSDLTNRSRRSDETQRQITMKNKTKPYQMIRLLLFDRVRE